MKKQLFKKERPNAGVPDVNPSGQATPEVDDLQACIAHRAYELYEQEGCCHGHDLDHWLEAERQILGDDQKK